MLAVPLETIAVQSESLAFRTGRKAYGACNPADRLWKAAVVGILHAAFIAVLLAATPARHFVHESAALMVAIIEQKAPKPAAIPSDTRLPVLQSIATTAPPPPLIEIAPTTPAQIGVATEPPKPLPAASQLSVEVAMPIAEPPRFDADYLDNPNPVYPKLSKRLNEAGKVILSVYVEADGSPSRVELQTSSRFERLDQAAIDAVKRWRFVAARRGNVSIAAWVIVPIHFSLKP